MKFLQNIPPYLFFTGKGGVGKTSISCATAIRLAEQGKRVLLVSTDPASNVGQVFDQAIGNTIRPVTAVPGLSALEIDPQEAAQQYRSRIVDPIKGLLRIYRHLSHSALITSTRANMKSQPATTQRAAKPCLSPVDVWQMLLTRLLEQHYGLTLNDTPFSEERVIQEHIDAGITLADAINFLVEKYELVRIDRRGFSWQEQTPYLTIIDIMRARRDLGLLNRN